MEVPRRHQPPFTLALPKPASATLCPLEAAEKVVKRNQTTEKLQERTDEATEKEDQDGDEKLSSEEETAEESVFLKTPVDNSELGEAKTARINSRLSSQDSFSEERLAEEAEEAKKKSEEEEAAAKERQAQRQQLAVEELVESERNYLRMLQLSTVTIRSNLQKLQV